MTAQAGQKVFGGGRFWGIPTQDAPTPTEFGIVQNMSLDFARDIKRLYGQNQLPADSASGPMTITGKVTMGTLNAALLGSLLLGVTPSTGQRPWISRESVTPSTLGVITPTYAAGWVLDLGLLYSTNNVPLTEVASTAPSSSGTYHVSSTGGYLVAVADAGVVMKLSYLYSTSAGQTVSMTNQPMGKTGQFTAVMALLWGTGSLTEKSSIQLNSCIASAYGVATVLDDYTKPTFTFDASADANDVLGTWTFAEIS